jgi:hypothetical protein
MHTNIADPGSASGATFQCMQFLGVFINFFNLSCSYRPSLLLGLQTKTRRWTNSSTFFSFNPVTVVSSMAIGFVHAVHKRSQNVQKSVGVHVPVDLFPGFNHHSIILVLIALACNQVWAVLELRTIKSYCKNCFSRSTKSVATYRPIVRTNDETVSTDIFYLLQDMIIDTRYTQSAQQNASPAA